MYRYSRVALTVLLGQHDLSFFMVFRVFLLVFDNVLGNGISHLLRCVAFGIKGHKLALWID